MPLGTMDHYQFDSFPFPKIETSHGLNGSCSYFVEQTENDHDNKLMGNFCELDWVPMLPSQRNQLYCGELENFSFELPPFDGESFMSGYDYEEEASMMVGSGSQSSVQTEEHVQIQEKPKKGSRKKHSVVLEFDDIRKHFNVPITEAAKQMNVGLTFLKKRCRELNIMRWPHRKIKSLNSLIGNVKEMGLTEEVPMLEQNISMMENLQDMELNEKAKKLRQACFKAKHHQRRRSSLPLEASTS